MSQRSQNSKLISLFPLENDTFHTSNSPVHLMAVSRHLTLDEASNRILDMILERAMEYTSADGGSLYLVEEVPQDSLGGARPKFRHVLRFHKSSSISHGKLIEMVNQILPIDDKSMAGWVAGSGKSLRIRDCYALPEDCPFNFNPAMDKAINYRTKSSLAIPIKTGKNAVLGVVQLVNKVKVYRRREERGSGEGENRIHEKDIVAFSENDERLIEAFASHAAFALENAKLTQDIADLFESFVRASVTAIEARDPSTSGHSDRVANLTVDFAQKVDRLSSGPFSDIKFSVEQIRELRYAALLHDFGKIGVREDVLLKAKKLFPHELETIFLRLETLRAKNEARTWRETSERLVRMIEDSKPSSPQNELGKTLWTLDQFNRQVEDIRRGVLVANEPQVLDRDFDIKKLMSWIQEMGQKVGQMLLTQSEAARLSIPQGTLSREERDEINSHVSFTYQFLTQIAWTEDLSGVPDIAHAHHEKLDGTGYPRQLKADQIPIQARMMTISDIYDALTAMDRPYKKAVSPERAIDILHMESKSGKLDTQLLQIFIEAQVFKVVASNKNPYKKAG